VGTFLTRDLVVAPGVVRRDAMNTDNFRASAFVVGDWDGILGQIYYEPNIINRGEMYLESGGLVAGS
jgi:hypothetical protein